VSYRARDVVAAARAEVASALVPPGAWPALEALACAVPDGADPIGFEVRLAEGDGPIDLGAALAAGGEAAARLAGHEPGALDRLVEASDGWRRLRDFARAWTVGESLLARWVPFLFLEVDAEASAALAPTPSVFVALDAPLDEPPGAGSTAFAVAQEAARLLQGDAFAGPTEERVVACFEALPDAGQPLHLGAMLGRKAPGVRLSMVMPREALPGYLHGIGWRADDDALERCLARYEPPSGFVQVDFDVADAVRPRLGLAYRPERPEGWVALLDRLVTDGLCAGSRRDALLAWPGEVTRRLEGYGFPCRMARENSHVKLSVEPGRPLEAKAYFSVSARPAFFA
jgi:hypothetical protein